MKIVETNFDPDSGGFVTFALGVLKGLKRNDPRKVDSPFRGSVTGNRHPLPVSIYQTQVETQVYFPDYGAGYWADAALLP